MQRIDLDATGILFDTDDGVANFYSLRHSFLSHLATDGLHPKLAQQLARHSAITLTMDRYSHVGLLDLDAALESLPTFVLPEPQAMRATGKTHDASDFSCKKNCTRPAEISHSQPISSVTLVSRDDFSDGSETLEFR